tara:strand:- start:66 stop:1319 length:1254 start_codon:yes stop_codon:yes gene_type:complete
MPLKQTTSSPEATKLALSVEGVKWLEQFSEVDRRLARDVLSSLTLVSHNEFERTIEELVLERAETINGVVALFAVREMDFGVDYFSGLNGANGQEHVDAVGRGADIGSEGRIASIIRDIAKSNPNKFLNHPSVESMRAHKCRALMLVDDLIGSGRRARSFAHSLWINPTIKSWASLKYIETIFVSYALANAGRRIAESSPMGGTCYFARFCPALVDFQPPKLIPFIHDLFRTYGNKTSKPHLCSGYKKSAALLVFEHSCPNNVPAILWAPSTPKKPWVPLFPNRVVQGETRSVFPQELTSHTPVDVMLSAGYAKAALVSDRVYSHASSKEIVALLALISKGVKTPSSICFSMRTTIKAANMLVESCISRGLLTQRYRLTALGRSVLRGAMKSNHRAKRPLPNLGNDMYYPSSLRRSR